jgi:hypothetical protein
MTEGAVVVKTRKFKRNPLLSRRQVCEAKRTRKKEQKMKKTPWRRVHAPITRSVVPNGGATLFVPWAVYIIVVLFYHI